MAEIVVVPKKFTSEWFSYIWDYYKYHIIAVVAVILVAVYAIVTAVTSVKYDTNLNIVTKTVIEREKIELLASECEKNSDDLNGNDRVDINATQLSFTDYNLQNGEMHSALINKLIAMFSSSDEVVYIVDSHIIDTIEGMKGTDNLFIPADEWSYEDVVKKGDFAVSLSNSKALKDLKINGEDLYIMLARHGNEEVLKPVEENGIKIARFLIK